MGYTSEQKSTIEYLINRGKSVFKRLQSCENEAENEKLHEELKGIKVELNEALNAEAIFRTHLRLAQEHLDEAEKILKKWH